MKTYEEIRELYLNATGRWTDADWTHEIGQDDDGEPIYCDGDTEDCETCAEAKDAAADAEVHAAEALAALDRDDIAGAKASASLCLACEDQFGDAPTWGAFCRAIDELTNGDNTFARIDDNRRVLAFIDDGGDWGNPADRADIEKRLSGRGRIVYVDGGCEIGDYLDVDDEGEATVIADGWMPHDGSAEVGYCRRCGNDLNPTDRPEEMTNDGGCGICGAGSSDVGIRSDHYKR